MPTPWIKVIEDATIPDDDWLLVVIDFNEPYRTPDAIRLAYWDKYDKKWCTQFGPLKSHWQVTHWMRLPPLPEKD